MAFAGNNKIMNTIKNAGYAIAFVCGWVCEYTHISQEAIYILTVLMIADTLFGIVKSMKLGTTSSTKLTTGVLSKFILLLIPISISLAGILTGINLKPMAIGTINIMAMAELYSIVTNAYIIRTGNDVKEFDAIALMLKKVKSIVEKMLKTLTEL